MVKPRMAGTAWLATGTTDRVYTPQWYVLLTPLTLLDRVEVVIQCHGTLCASWLANSTVLLAKDMASSS